jgi:predicted acetylornithine/succinylornithine family transaminase
MNSLQIEDESIIPLYRKRGLGLVKGEGAYVVGHDGKKYLDFTSQYGTTVLGHGHPALIDAVKEQLVNIVSVHNSFYSEPRAQLAAKLVEISYLDKVFFFSTGTECVEAALKFARATTGRKKFIAAKMSYHGRTMGALAATGQAKYKKDFEPLVVGFEHLAFNNLDALEEALNDDVAAVILEPIQAEAGIFVPSDDYLAGVRELCDKYGALLILDEIQVGTYRTGSFLASEPVQADIVCISKGIGNGLPLGAVLISNEVSEKLPSGAHGTTFGGNPLCCSAGLAVLDAAEGLVDNVKEMGELLMTGIKEIQEKSSRIRAVRGRGLIIGIEFKEKVGPIMKAMQENGILVLSAGSTVLRILPPYIITKKECETFLKALEEIVV